MSICATRVHCLYTFNWWAAVSYHPAEYLKTMAVYLLTTTVYLPIPAEYLWTSTEHLPTSFAHLSTSAKYLQISELNHLTSDANLQTLAEYQPGFFTKHPRMSANRTGFILHKKSLMTNQSPFITRLRRSHMGENSFLLFRRWSNYSSFLLKKDLHSLSNCV